MNQNQSVKRKLDSAHRDILLNGIVILLCAILFVQIFLFIREVTGYQNVYWADEVTLIREITDRQYDSLMENVYRNEALGVPVKGDMAEIYAAAYYYEAAMLYNAHKKAGNVRQAEEKYAQMQTYEEQMGAYASVKEEICAFLGMNPEILK